ncbi:MAG: PDZ domain-containing protein [Acidobacteriota bacterium]|nr:PDZ domain-containing protein [Acidobacteriota bacterium]
MSRILALLFALMTASVCLAEAPPPLLLQHPTLNATQIAFVYAGELWIVPREGGVAKRLTSGVGTVSKPSFSADGTEIAFTGEYNGNSDVYIIPASGGVPRRITYHPAVDSVVGWTRDGKQVLFASNRNSYDSFNRLFTISRDGGFPTELPFPIGAEGSYSPDGNQIAYVPLDHAFEIWKRYRGGRTSPIWIAQLKDSSITKIPRDNSNDFNPIWVDHHIFFLSDRQGPITLFSYDTRTKSITKVLKNDGFDFKYASAGPGAIVIEQFGSLYLYDLKSGKDRKLDIRVEADLPEMRAHFLNVAGRIEHADISPTGKRAVFEARGEILTVPAEKGDIRNITNTPGVDERSPAWSPNGDRIAYFSDESGEYALHIKNQNGLGEVTKIDLGSPGSFFFVPFWSPDGKKIAYADKRLNVWYVDLENKKPVKVFSDRFAEGEQNSRLAWSPDSKWLAYTQQELSHMRSVFLYSLETGQSHRVTDGMSDSFSPVFDKSGKYLYLLASTDDGPTLDGSMMSMNRPVSSSVYITVLRKDLPSPLAPESDEETGAKPETPKGEGSGKTTPPPVVKVDFEKIGQRILALPLPAQHYLQLQPGKEGSVFIEDASSSMGRMRGAGGVTVSRFDLKTRKAEMVKDGLSAYIVSANGEKMLYRTAGGGAGAPSWFIASIPNSGGAPKGGADAASGPKALNTAGMEVRVDPPVEWRQMYHEAFRLERDFFYDVGFHGLDLKAAEKVYEPYLAGVASRGDLNYIFREAFGNITVGHMYVVGGETPPVEAVPVGLLGADYRIENGRYRFSHIYDGENWNPQLRAPLTQPGVNVNEGDYLLAVNGRDVSGSSNIFSFFEMTANQSVVLRVGPDPSGAGSREVTVVPVASEAGLRKTAWVEGNRRKVDQLSHGKFAYIYLPDTSMGGYASFNRYFFSQAGKQGAVVDERFNHGGINTDYILDYLRRTLMNYRTMRDGEDTTTPVSLIQGPKAMIINEYAGSGGDAMPFHFRQAHIGLLVGKRTWGGLVGFAGPSAALMDGGSVTAPSRGFWTPNNAWEVENHGVAPDVEVDLNPQAVREGHDPQLEKTVDLLLQELAKHPIPVYHKPPYPNYHQNVGGGKASTAN